jgi:hypothetical protein
MSKNRKNIIINKKELDKVGDSDNFKIHLLKQTKGNDGKDIYSDAGDLEIKIFQVPKPGFFYSDAKNNKYIQ